MRWLSFGFVVVFAAAGGCKVYDESWLRAAEPRTVTDDVTTEQDAGPVVRPGDIRAQPRRDAGAHASAEAVKGDASAPMPDASQPPQSSRNRDAGIPEAGSPNEDDDAGAPRNDAGVDGGAESCIAASTADYCASLPHLPQAPHIDGLIDCGLQLQQVVPVGWNGLAWVSEQPVAFIAAAWRSDGLYLYVAVRGSVPAPHPAGTRIDCGDAVELHVDADGNLAGKYDTPGTAQFIIAAPAINNPGTIEAIRYYGGVANGMLAAQSVATAVLEDGYAVEAFISASDLGLTAWMLQPNGMIGLDIGVDVSGMPYRTSSCAFGNQRGQYFLRVSGELSQDCNGEPFCDDRAFCMSRVMP